MCGIAGFVALGNPAHGQPSARDSVQRMLDVLRHRGPNDSGIWAEASDSLDIAIGNRRLAILDLSPAGRQPMISPSGRHVLTFNGEIYNHRALRRELEGRHQFVSSSDTEVLLAAISEWGLDLALERIDGMFAFALLDRAGRSLYLARDRIGEKPLYYGRAGQNFAFASELDAVTSACTTRPDVDRDALTLLLRFNCIPAPFTVYRAFRQLPPATLACLDMRRPDQEPVLSSYWSPTALTEAPPARSVDHETVDELDELLHDAVALRMRSDVPIGAFLSGGIDSSTVVAMMQAESSTNVRTYTIGFTDPERDEADWARTVARRLGTDHTELYVTGEEALGVIPTLPGVYDEPFADPSQIPTVLLAQLAKRDVTVALSGDGGDELFGGYPRYSRCARTWGESERAPRTGWSRFAPLLTSDLAREAMRMLERADPRGHVSSRVIPRLEEAMLTRSREQLYLDAVSFHRDPAALLVGGREPATLISSPLHGPRIDDFVEWMMYVDLVTYLPDFVLTKVDRATMSVSLESRAPLLDRRIVEFALRQPMKNKFRGGEGKWALRQVLERYVEADLVDRPKLGFDPPLGEWLRGPLRDWAEAMLSGERLRREGYFHPAAVRALWRDHCEREDHSYTLWCILAFQSWLEHVAR